MNDPARSCTVADGPGTVGAPAPAQPGWAARVLIGVVRAYRLLLKAWIGNACRFEPSCSAYALDALRRHGAAQGSALAAGRLLRCHPWCDGGHDPVPDRPRGLFSRLGLTSRPDASTSTGNPP